MRPNAPCLDISPASSDVLLNVRRGSDYATLGWMLAPSYYHECIERMGSISRVYICGNGLDAAVKVALEKYRPIYLGGTMIEHLSLFQRFRRIILSNSTFAWWAGYLSEADEILYPGRSADANMYTFCGFREVDLRVSEPRYIEVDCGLPVTTDLEIVQIFTLSEYRFRFRRDAEFYTKLRTYQAPVRFSSAYLNSNLEIRRIIARLLRAKLIDVRFCPR